MFDINKIIVKPETKISLSDYKTDYHGDFDKDSAKKETKRNVKELAKLQEVLYADERYSVLIILQAPDAAGKDGAIRHVMSGVNPQGCRVDSFKSPSKEELQHDYLWRHYTKLPERGMIEIFNRSHYENILVTKVHPEYNLGLKIPGYDTVDKIDDGFWQKRYDQINNFEKHLAENGTIILKFFLNLSKEEQKERFLSRLDEQEKNWKFNSGDIDERQHWDKYKEAYEDMLNNTSTEYAPWHIIPADNKWFSRVSIGDIIEEKLKSLNLRFPEGEGDIDLEVARKRLMDE